MILSDISSYVTEKADAAICEFSNYVSTESMLPNRGGITTPSSLPNAGKVTVFKAGDVLLSNIRPYFKKTWLANRDGLCSGDVLVFRKLPDAETTPEFLYALISSDEFISYDMATSKGTKMPRGDKAALMKYEFTTLMPDDQVKVGYFLSLLNRKMSLNTKINDYLEQLGQLLIGRYSANTEEPAELGDILAFGNGFAFKSSTYTESGSFRILTIKNVQDGNVDCSDSKCIDELPAKMKDFCKLQLGDVVLSLTGNVGRVGIVAEENCLLNQRVAVLQPKVRSNLAALYFWFRQSSFQNAMIGIAKGTAQANLSPVETLRLSIPFNSDTFNALAEECKPLFDCILANKQESLYLEELRDALLPKLISGEIDVSQVDLTLLNNHLA